MSMRSQIEKKLQQAFTPSHLEVINESANHNVPVGSESHFKVIVVSESFAEQRLIQRHRAVNTVLKEELAHHIHALAIHTYSPQEWQHEQKAPDSPKCAGGSA